VLTWEGASAGWSNAASLRCLQRERGGGPDASRGRGEQEREGQGQGVMEGWAIFGRKLGVFVRVLQEWDRQHADDSRQMFV